MDNFRPLRPDRSDRKVQACSLISTFETSTVWNILPGQMKIRIWLIYFAIHRLLRTDARAVRPPPFRIYAILEHLPKGVIVSNSSQPRGSESDRPIEYW